MPSTVDTATIAGFEKVASAWWDPHGPFRPLHQINPIRIEYIYGVCQRLLNLPFDQRLQALDILDVGCGGGLVAESLARLGANVTGIDAGNDAIAIAEHHAQQELLTINYLCGEVDMLLSSDQKYDVIVALEIIEHVNNVDNFMATLSQLLNPQGLLIISTLNRTLKSYALGIVAAEYILRWVPRGTHQWDKFIKPSELAAYARNAQLHIQEIKGLTFNPLHQQWKISHDVDVNYFMAMQLI